MLILIQILTLPVRLALFTFKCTIRFFAALAGTIIGFIAAILSSVLVTLLLITCVIVGYTPTFFSNVRTSLARVPVILDETYEFAKEKVLDISMNKAEGGTMSNENRNKKIARELAKAFSKLSKREIRELVSELQGVLDFDEKKDETLKDSKTIIPAIKLTNDIVGEA